MGFGYNPDLVRFGERLDILNFFSWMKRIQGFTGPDWTIFDASSYAIVNRTPAKRIGQLGERPTAKQILEVLVTEQERPKRAELMQNCERRSQYLRRLIEICEIRATYFDAREEFRGSVKYEQALEAALWFVKKLEQDKPDLIARIQPNNPNPASQLYLPLEIAEALYLSEVRSVDTKFGPTTEEYFDEAILGLLEGAFVGYTTLRCSFGPRKPGYLSDRNVILTQSSDSFVESVLKNDSGYRNFVASYLNSFRNGDEPLEQCAIRVRDEMKLDEAL